MSEFFNLEKILTLFNYIFWFFMLNIFFIVLNIPVILFFMFIGLRNVTTYLPLFLISLIPFGASFTTLLYCMRKLIKYKDISLIEDLKKGLKYNFKQSTIMWSLELLLIFLLSFNLRFFSTTYYNLILSSLFIGFLIITLLTTTYIFVLISRFSMNSIEILRASVILTFTKPLISIGNVLIFLFTLILFEISPGTTVIFMGSIASFLVMLLNKNLLENLEEKSNQT
ncbi:DUF624 domain-containing protein [Clostridium sp.]|uniref:DUF624 domain-containing protein n=1 Tax=Clostridium sp. TaxID=1506 RepID=UPI0026374C69|nr:DUF624 domain-containing protein [Clostridium sp.]